MPNVRKILQIRQILNGFWRLTIGFSSRQEMGYGCDGDRGGGIGSRNMATVVNVAVETRVLLSHLQHLVVVKVRRDTPNPSPISTFASSLR